jgi:hypothetical protein
MKNQNLILSGLLGGILMVIAGCATPPKHTAVLENSNAAAETTYNAITNGEDIILKNDRFDTPRTFRPPVEITIVAKTDSTNLRIGYAADQVIFNWELDRNQLRVDGGPANGLHRLGAGGISTGKFATICWLVLTNRQMIYVNGDLRFEHSGDYSSISKCISVFSAAGSTVTVKSIVVKQLSTRFNEAATNLVEAVTSGQIENWIAQLGDSNFSKRNAMVKLLAQHSVEALPALQQALKTETDNDRRWWLQAAIQQCQ